MAKQLSDNMLQHKIVLLKTLMVIMGIAIFIMGFVRYFQGAVFQSVADFVFVALLAFFFLRISKNPKDFKIYARVVVFFAFVVSIFLILSEHDADSRLIWFSTTLFLLFYVLDKEEGWKWFFAIIFGLIFLYIFDPALFGLSIVEFTIFIFNMFIIALIVSWYEKIKENSQNQLLLSKKFLEKKVLLKTEELRTLNDTLEKKIEEEIVKNNQAHQQMLQQSRLAQMGEMISMIAHQWRQPLGAISATSGDLRMKFILDKYDVANNPKEYDKCKEYFEAQLSEIEGYVQTLTTTIDDFRNFYKPNKLSRTMYVKEPVEKALDIIKASIVSDGIELKHEFNATKKVVIYDSELMQVFLNILKNSQDNFKEKNIKNPQISIISSNCEDGVKIKFCDNGGGVSKKIIEKIFDPYFSTKNEKNGTGLGLYMSKIIIQEHHHGKLYIENTEKGVCFIVELPSNNLSFQ